MSVYVLPATKFARLLLDNIAHLNLSLILNREVQILACWILSAHDILSNLRAFLEPPLKVDWLDIFRLMIIGRYTQI